jgi:hypothetical protein
MTEPTAESASPSTDEIRLMADLILAICRCRHCGEIPPEEELMLLLSSSGCDLKCGQIKELASDGNRSTSGHSGVDLSVLDNFEDL